MFQKLASGLTGIFGFVLLALTLQAQEFSGELVSKTSDGKVLKSKIYRTANKERVDSIVDAVEFVRTPDGKVTGKTQPVTKEMHMITDRVQKVRYVVEPQKKLITVASFNLTDGSSDKSCAPILSAMISAEFASGCKQLGLEKINGRSTVKWEMRTGGGILPKQTITMWVDSQLKASIKSQSDLLGGGELQNIRVGSQPASLFELPADYRRQ